MARADLRIKLIEAGKTGDRELFKKVTESLIGNNNQEYLEFLKITSRLFAENIVFEDEKKKWVADNNNYEIAYERGKIVILNLSPVRLSVILLFKI